MRLLPGGNPEGVSAYIVPAIWVVGGVAAGLLVERYVMRRLVLGAEHAGYLARVFIPAFRGMVGLWIALGGIYIAFEASPVPDRIAAIIGKLLIIAVLGSVTLAATRAAGGAVTYYGMGTEEHLLSATLFSTIAQALVGVMGILIILNSLGIAITPLITAFGVGGLAAALALKDTLANLFAGIQIVGSRELIPGDYVHIDGAGEGFVEDINWRYTTIRDWPNRTIVVPNEKLANSIFAHYRMPTSHAIIALPFHVELDSDLGLIEQGTLKAARAAVNDLQLAAQTRDPFVRFDGFGQSRVEMTVFVEIPKGFDRVQAHNALFKRVHAQLHGGPLTGGVVPEGNPAKAPREESAAEDRFEVPVSGHDYNGAA